MVDNLYRNEVIGSLLRPEYLKEATRRAQAGEITSEELSAVQDRAVLEAIALQEQVGVDIIADGEMRRRGWTDPLTRSVVGYGQVARPADYRVNWNGPGGEAREAGQQVSTIQAPQGMVTAVIAKIERGPVNLPLEEQRFLQAHSRRPSR